MGRMTIKPTCKVLGYSLLHLFARTAHSFACSALLAALIRSVARSLTRSRAHGKDVYEVNASISYSFNPLCAAAESEPRFLPDSWRIFA